MNTLNTQLVRNIQFIRTTDLLIKKVSVTRQIHLFKLLIKGFAALLALSVAEIFKMYYGDTTNINMMVWLFIASFYATVIIVFLDSKLAIFLAELSIICDVLAMRLNSSAKKSSE
jgi:hypothetical protein